MKYYFKHLLRLVRKRPFQPLLVIFILTLAFLLENISFSSSIALEYENEASRLSEYGTAQVTIEISSKSRTRFISCEEVTRLFPEAVVCGSYTLPYLMDGEPVEGTAVSFEEVGKIFSLAFTEYKDFTEANKASVILISKTFSENNGVRLGDKLTLSLFGKTCEYEVCGISPTPFFGSSDIVCDISGIIDILAEKSTLFSMFADDVSLYGRLYVRMDMEKGAAYDKIRAAFPEYTVATTDKLNETLNEGIFDAVAFVSVFLCFIAAFAVILGCTFCLSKERKEYSTLFSTVGITEKQALLFRIIEMIAYWFIACIIGALISEPLGDKVFSMLEISFSRYTLTFKSLLTVSGSIFVLTVLSPVIEQFRKVSGKKKKLQRKGLISLLCAGLMLLFIGLAVVLPCSVKFYVAVPGFIFSFLFLTFFTETAIRFISTRLEKRKCTSKNYSLLFALKNCKNIPELINSSMLFSVLAQTFLLCAYCVFVINTAVISTENYLNGNYIIMGGNEATYELIEQIPEVEEIYTLRISDDSKLKNGKTLRLWATDNLDLFSGNSKFAFIPEGNDVVCSDVFSNGYGLELGKEFVAYRDSEETIYRLVSVNHGMDLVFLTGFDSIPDATSYYVVEAKDGVNNSELFGILTTELSEQMVSVMPVDSLLKLYIKSEIRYVYFCRLLLIMIAVFGIIGIANNVIDSIKSRKDELSSFAVCGLRKKQVLAMLTYELLTVFLTGLLLTLILIWPNLLLVEKGLNQYAATGFVYVGIWFKDILSLHL